MTALQNFVGTPSELTGPDHAGKTINRPPDRRTGATFKKAPKARVAAANDKALFEPE